ncbi:nucleotidyltransferase family protein [Brevundimonas sp. C43]|uniref:nucleotidyltransferase family protein n=1 Tax=Brevundimonas sp. C43 TaxID=3068314 RepID=UPI00273E4201|nr:nucleotidyltransferase domain-containing protein [Brevundimonas sp. C43]
MNSAAVIAVLREHEGELRRQGVAHAALFGSVARGDARPDSDLDIMVQIDPAAEVNLYDYVGITQFIGDLFEGRADVSDREMLIEQVRREAEREAIFAF